jgi:hypothetical protein
MSDIADIKADVDAHPPMAKSNSETVNSTSCRLPLNPDVVSESACHLLAEIPVHLSACLTACGTVLCSLTTFHFASVLPNTKLYYT